MPESTHLEIVAAGTHSCFRPALKPVTLATTLVYETPLAAVTNDHRLSGDLPASRSVGQKSAGIVGVVEKGKAKIENCYSDYKFNGYSGIGGIVGTSVAAGVITVY